MCGILFPSLRLAIDSACVGLNHSETDARIRRRFNKDLAVDEMPITIQQYCETLSSDPSAIA
jgi:hypothetical protein